MLVLYESTDPEPPSARGWSAAQSKKIALRYVRSPLKKPIHDTSAGGATL